MTQTNCSFCSKSSDDLAVMIEGPNRVFICNECVAVCSSIVVVQASKAILARLPSAKASIKVDENSREGEA